MRQLSKSETLVALGFKSHKIRDTLGLYCNEINRTYDETTVVTDKIKTCYSLFPFRNS